MINNILTKIGNFISLIGEIGLGISIGILVLLLIYVLLYTKFDILTHSYHKFVLNFKRWIKVIIVLAVIGFVLEMVGIAITPDPVQTLDDL